MKQLKKVTLICSTLLICALFTIPALAADNGIPADQPVRAGINKVACGGAVRTGKVAANLIAAPFYRCPKAFWIGAQNPGLYGPQKRLPEGVPTLPRAVAAAGNELGATIFQKVPTIAFAPDKKVNSLAKWDELTRSCKKGLDQPPVLQCLEAGAYIAMPLTASMGVIPATLVRQSGHVAIVSGGTSLAGTLGRTVAEEAAVRAVGAAPIKLTR